MSSMCVYTTMCSPLGTGCSSVGNLRFMSPDSKPAPVQAPLFLPGICCITGFPWESQLPLDYDLLWHAPQAPLWTSMGCRARPASPWSSPWAAEESQLQQQEQLLPLLLYWPWCLQNSLSCIFSLLFPAVLAVAVFSPCLICYSRGTTAVTDGLGLGQRQVHPGAGWHWLHYT